MEDRAGWHKQIHAGMERVAAESQAEADAQARDNVSAGMDMGVSSFPRGLHDATTDDEAASGADVQSARTTAEEATAHVSVDILGSVAMAAVLAGEAGGGARMSVVQQHVRPNTSGANSKAASRPVVVVAVGIWVDLFTQS